MLGIEFSVQSRQMKPFAFGGILLVNVLIWLFVGYHLDEFFHTSPVFLLVGLLYSVIGSIVLLIKKTRA